MISPHTMSTSLLKYQIFSGFCSTIVYNEHVEKNKKLNQTIAEYKAEMNKMVMKIDEAFTTLEKLRRTSDLAQNSLERELFFVSQWEMAAKTLKETVEDQQSLAKNADRLRKIPVFRLQFANAVSDLKESAEKYLKHVTGSSY
jgi:uncharacterized coiled-coil DUF342 family protein